MRYAFWVLILTLAAWAQPSGKRAEVDRIFSEFHTGTPGCAVGVAHQGKVVLQAGYGMADLERNVVITPDTVFESGSIAKQFTAAALLLLEQQGKLSLDDPMRKYLPELPDYGTPVTIRQVISHTSGLREWRPIAAYGGMPEGNYVYTNADLLRFAANQRSLNFDPGSAYSYTNTGYNIATILVERTLGDGGTFATFTRKHIFGPLGMEHSQWRNNFRAVVPHRALAYERKDGVLLQRTPIENITGAGGLLTTVADLLAWNENFTHAKVGGPGFVKAQQMPAKLTNGKAIPYGAGLLLQDIDGAPEVSHSGATGGYRTWLGRYPDQAVSVVVLCNYGAANPTALGRATARLWTGTKPQQAPVSTYAPQAGELERLSGRYRRVHDHTVVALSLADGKLHVDKLTELRPLSAGIFAAGTTDQRYHVEDGVPLRLRIASPFGDTYLERVEPVTPSPMDLAKLTGKYESKETESVITIAQGAAAGELTYRVGTNSPVVLKPAYPDAFSGPGNEIFRFYRDSHGKVIAFGIGEPRVWDLRFTRLP